MSETFEIETGCEPINQVLKSVWSFCEKSIEMNLQVVDVLKALTVAYDELAAQS